MEKEPQEMVPNYPEDEYGIRRRIFAWLASLQPPDAAQVQAEPVIEKK